MKVRISGNKIRFRLKQPEVNQFQQKGSVSEVLEFGSNQNDQIKFTLSESNTSTIDVQFKSNETTVLVPKEQAKEWTSTDLVGFDAEVDTGKGKKIGILVEKDFMCMDGREEDNVGSYPNPLASA
ncbi:MAG TPA: hypothetical protein VLJ41_11835 [Segetibacter sp.]|nr:hypothetical protein [Segetibacter sp.]